MKKELEMTRKYFDSNEIPTRRMLWNKIIELQVKLYYDPLTSVYNRKYYQDVIEKEYATKECYVMMADINNLKQINDEYGHPDGDMLIAKVAAKLSVFGKVIRMSGDEFLVIIENATMLDILYVYETKDFTFGIIYKTETMSMEQAYKFADKEMYLKKERKN